MTTINLLVILLTVAFYLLSWLATPVRTTTYKQESPALTWKYRYRGYALQLTQFLLQYWPSRSMIFISSKGSYSRMPLSISDSNFDPISPYFRDMANFPLKNAHFYYSLQSTPNFKMFFCTKSLKFCKHCASLRHGANCSCKKFSYDLPFGHNTSVRYRRQYNTIQWKICTQKLTNTLSV